jgi:hypothetical protein
MTNLERLKQAGLVSDDCEFNDDEESAIEALTHDEVNALISSKDKLGEDFINRHMPHGMMF